MLVRYIMQDDAKRSPKAIKIIEALDDIENSGCVTLVSIIELAWVFGTSYELTRAQVAQALDSSIWAKQLKIESADEVIQALRVFKIGKSDFADCLIERSANGAGCEKTIRFDVNSSKYAGMTLIS